MVLAATAVRSQEVLDQIVAVVDDKIILQSELMQFTYSFAIQAGINPENEPDKLEALRAETLTNMINNKVMLVQARLDSIEVSDKDVESYLDQQIQQMIARLGSEKRVEEYFGEPIRQVRREFREEIKERLLVERLRETKSREIKISRREVEDFYKAHKDSLPTLRESVRLRHILFKVEPTEMAIAQAKEKAASILGRLRAGEDFAELAKQYSEDPGTASRGGDLGSTKRLTLVPEFEEVAFLLEPGQISDLVRTQFGFHIIQLLEKAGEKIHTRHILIKLDTAPEDEKRKVEEIKKIRQQIIEGELTFAEAVQKYSKDESTLDRDGDLGLFEIDQLQSDELKRVVSAMKVGEITEPLKITEFGYQLIRIEDRQQERKMDIRKDWEQIEGWALNLKQQNEIQKWLDRIRQDVYIEIKS
jgi:peptidyl-prolyl cis-trans isomerase SurA